jgi:signal transduction histidine kinase
MSTHIRLTVSDTGKGVKAEFLPCVFERFRQADDEKQGPRGLGLGLAIVRHIVERHGGKVQAQSPGMGQGATFTVRLPFISTQKAIKGSLDQIQAEESAAEAFSFK